MVATDKSDESSAEFCAVVAAMLQDEKNRDVLTVARYVLACKSDDTPALFFASKASQAMGDIESAMGYMTRLVETGRVPADFPFDLPEEVRNLLVAAVGEHGRYIEAGRYQEALTLTEKMLILSPQAKPFIESALSLCRAMGDSEKEAGYRLQLRELNKAEHEQLQAQANKHHEAGQYDEELPVRIAIFQNPYDLEIHSAWRLQNIHSALGCFFNKPLDLERQQLAKKLISAVPSPYDITQDPDKSDMLGRFDKFYRLSLKAIEIDAIYGSPKKNSDKSSMLFANSAGCSLTVDDIRQKIRDQNVQIGFFTQGSEAYFKVCAKNYVESILKNCKASCLVFFCVAGAWDTAENVAKQLGIDDERLIICVDDYVYIPEEYRVYNTHDIKNDDKYPPVGSHYYAVVGLLYLFEFLYEFSIPMFLSGMDTILQHDVRDLVEKHHDADVVVNKLNKSGSGHLSSDLINSLLLAYPTNNAMLFALFLKTHLGNNVRKKQQAFAIDQLFLNLAVHHVLANGKNPKVQYFDEFDINNCMFNVENVDAYRNYLKKFRFVNIFHAGQGDNALHGDDVMG
jgi:tetratricopeptide (TPR) repeat protein